MSNEEVLSRIKENRTLLDVSLITKRKGAWVGHIIREKGIIILLLEGTVEEVGRYGTNSFKFSNWWTMFNNEDIKELRKRREREAADGHRTTVNGPDSQ